MAKPATKKTPRAAGARPHLVRLSLADPCDFLVDLEALATTDGAPQAAAMVAKIHAYFHLGAAVAALVTETLEDDAPLTQGDVAAMMTDAVRRARGGGDDDDDTTH